MNGSWLALRDDWPWCTVRDLQDQGVIQVEDGNHGEYRPRPNEFAADGTAFIRAADISDGIVQFSTAGHVTDVALRRIRKGIGRPGDVLFSHKGTVGKVAVVPDNAPPFVCSPQTTFWRVLDAQRLDRDFLFAFMRAPEFVRQWTVRKGDTDMADYVSLTAQRTLLVPLPPLSIQRKIASILSAYDDLIENNDRRIKILEEMAQRIYREWFVDFRYPGHKDVPLVESRLGAIPRDWRIGRLGGEIELVYGKALKAGARRGGSVAVFGSSGIVGHHDQKLVDGPGVILGRKGNVGSVHWSDGDFFAIDTTFWVRSCLPLTYCYFVLSTIKFLDSHAAVPGLSRDQAYAVPILVPGSGLLARFDSFITEIFALRYALDKSTARAREMRDLLLPLLLAGNVDVSELNIATPTAAM